jgi:hypothetical protein
MIVMRSKEATFLIAAAISTAGCGGPAAPIQAPPAVQPATRIDSAGSWMAPSAARQNLLYVSDSDGTVRVFSYPGLKQVGLLQGFKSPAGLCSDPRNGDVYVVDTNSLDIFKYKHGGKKPIKMLTMFAYFPFGCAVDPTSGDLAIANYSAQPSGPGSLSIFRRGAFFPSTYTDAAFNAYFFCSYDDRGNVFVDGADSNSYHTEFAELPHGSTSFKAIRLDRVIGFPGGVQWDGEYMAVQDTISRVLYRFEIQGSRGKAVSATRFKVDRSTLLHQFWIQGHAVVMPFGTASREVRMVGRWPYPSGGSPERSVGLPHATELVGVTVSLAQGPAAR